VEPIMVSFCCEVLWKPAWIARDQIAGSSSLL
jgi:hypothetical protein